MRYTMKSTLVFIILTLSSTFGQDCSEPQQSTCDNICEDGTVVMCQGNGSQLNCCCSNEELEAQQMELDLETSRPNRKRPVPCTPAEISNCRQYCIGRGFPTFTCKASKGIIFRVAAGGHPHQLHRRSLTTLPHP